MSFVLDTNTASPRTKRPRDASFSTLQWMRSCTMDMFYSDTNAITQCAKRVANAQHRRGCVVRSVAKIWEIVSPSPSLSLSAIESSSTTRSSRLTTSVDESVCQLKENIINVETTRGGGDVRIVAR
eukprot:TRINITY_DN8917_c1_g1_i1.p1 TRINITY_DN8917_c1_g1~~TRINITY_DN8917_c1_g1_i1.p1  ORF type:complete len:126 (+),score=27.34 TRINITY_DN8917_c1_g1_i1:79-456(+)